MSTSFKGPIYGSADANGGALAGLPLDFQVRSEWVTYFNDFGELTANDMTTADWSVTQVSSGGAIRIGILAAEGGDIGALVLDCPANEDGPIAQLDNSIATGLVGLPAITPAAAVAGTSVASEFFFASRFNMATVANQGIFVGMAEINSNSAIIATPEGAITSDTHIGFSQSDADAGALIFSAAGDADTTANSITGTDVLGSPLVDDEWIEVAVRGKGVNLFEAWVKRGGAGARWRRIGGGTLNQDWNAQMLVSLANLGGAAGDDLIVDYVYFQSRRDLLV
jgi:hypothetical protein